MTPVLHPGPARRPRFSSHVEAAVGFLRSRGVCTEAEFDSLPPAELEAHLRARFGGVRLPYVRSAMITPRHVQEALKVCDAALVVAPDGTHVTCAPDLDVIATHVAYEPKRVEVSPGALEAALDALEEDPTRSLLERGLASKVEAALVQGTSVNGYRVVGLRHSELCF